MMYFWYEPKHGWFFGNPEPLEGLQPEAIIGPFDTWAQLLESWYKRVPAQPSMH